MCIFCDIAGKKIPAEIVYENEHVFCIRDIKPVAPVHLLIISKKHYEDILALADLPESSEVMTAVTKAVSDIAEQMNLDEGFRLINNCRENGGQTVMHLHFHIIGKTKLTPDIV